jgi:RNA polymerase sigma-70 factor (ECF subfamily)
MDLTSLSLLERARSGSDPDWDRLVGLYRPLIFNWLRRQGLPHDATEELTQDVLMSVFRGLATFAHPGQPGAFRGWLRVITANRGRAYWRANQPRAPGGSDFHEQMHQLEDPHSAASQQWDREHDQHIVHRLLEQIEGEFPAKTMRAFRRQVFDGTSATAVAAELEMSVGAVYVAKSRVLARLRKEAEGLTSIDALP